MNFRELITKLCCFNFYISCVSNINYRGNINENNFDIEYILLEDLEKEKKDKCIQTEIIEEERSIEEEKRLLDIHIENNDLHLKLVHLSEMDEIGDFLMDEDSQLERSNFDFIN